MDTFITNDNKIVIGLDGAIDVIREKCGDDIADNIGFYFEFYSYVLSAYSSYDNLENEEQAQSFIEDIEAEL